VGALLPCPDLLAVHFLVRRRQSRALDPHRVHLVNKHVAMQ
jgi:hypothetical protein